MSGENVIRTLILLPLVVSCCVVAARAQESEPTAPPTPQPTPLTAPPPLRTISKDEHLQIEGAKDAKRRVRTTIELADLHLTAAEKFTTESDFESASHEVGSYHALIQNALTFLATLKRDSNKTRDLYKRLELSLRASGPRLTNLRRITPLEFAVWIKVAEDFARESRTQALNSFYGQTVVRDPKPKERKRTEKPKETPTPQSQQP